MARPPPSVTSARPLPVSGMARAAGRRAALAAWLVRTSLGAGDQPLANQATGTAVALADANPGFAALAAAAAHSQGLATRDAGLLGEAAGQHPEPWARASAAKTSPSSSLQRPGTRRSGA